MKTIGMVMVGLVLNDAGKVDEAATLASFRVELAKEAKKHNNYDSWVGVEARIWEQMLAVLPKSQVDRICLHSILVRTPVRFRGEILSLARSHGQEEDIENIFTVVLRQKFLSGEVKRVEGSSHSSVKKEYYYLA